MRLILGHVTQKSEYFCSLVVSDLTVRHICSTSPQHVCDFSSSLSESGTVTMPEINLDQQLKWQQEGTKLPPTLNFLVAEQFS